tara:strand:+ start:15569 stop:15994 length:426 start_codon:yes stop_codon:yes gene_type:complete
MKETKWKDVREIPASGKRGWMGGAYTIAFVYSNRGNFIVKGYIREIDEYLSKLKDKGYKFIVNKTLWHTDAWTDKKQHRDIWSASSDKTYVHEPDYSRRDKKSRTYKWNIYRYHGNGNSKIGVSFKRFPKRWVPELDKIII